MMKIALALAAAAAVLTTAPLVTPADAQGIKMAQLDVQIGRDRDRDWDRDWDRRRRGPDATVGIGPGGVRIGPRERCRTVTTTVERGGRMVTRRERICD
jgi:Ni/Co efflux regulator RcnB